MVWALLEQNFCDMLEKGQLGEMVKLPPILTNFQFGNCEFVLI